MGILLGTIWRGLDSDIILCARGMGSKTAAVCHHSDKAPGGPGPTTPVVHDCMVSCDTYAAPTPCQRARDTAGIADNEEQLNGTSTPWLESMAAFKADARAQEGLIGMVGRVLDKTVLSNEMLHGACGATSMHPNFEGMHPCPLHPSAYISRIMKYSECSPCNLVVALIYLERLESSVRTDMLAGDSDLRGADRLRLTTTNVQRLLLTAVMLACKFFDEPVVRNKQWGLIGDLKVAEMNELELDMLWALKFSLNVTRDEYDRCCKILVGLDSTGGSGDTNARQRSGGDKGCHVSRRSRADPAPYSLNATALQRSVQTMVLAA